MIKRTVGNFILRNPRANISILILAITLLLVFMIMASRPEVERRSTSATIPSVHTMQVSAEDVQIQLHSRGKLEPAHEVQLTSQVAGKITYIARNFSTGSSFREGDVLLRVENSALALELQQAKAKLAQARLNEMETIANLEARSTIKSRNNGLSELARGKPQREVAAANTAAAEAALELARKQLQQATLKAPFDGRVLLRNVQQHEQLNPGTPIAKIYATDRYLLRLPITQQQLHFIRFANDKVDGSPVTVHDPVSGMQWQAEVLRSEGHIAKTRLVYVLAELDASELDESRQKLILPGNLLDAIITSRTLENIIKLPAAALRTNNTVWLLNDDNRLQTVPVELLYRSPETVYLSAGLKPGNRVITSHIAAVTENMRLNDLSHAKNNSDAREAL